MSKSESSNSGGIGFLGVLGIAFIVLKLCGVIDWSWWLVTLPLWIVFAIIVVVILVIGVVHLSCKVVLMLKKTSDSTTEG